ncbi:conserved hypothetical protein [gamma proteobacterium HdN1]|nr:conserved hypothetical protein [gamma proteobacterium HdN1]
MTRLNRVGGKAMVRKGLLTAFVALLVSMPGWANAAAVADRPSGLEMTADLVLARPLLLVSTVAGAGLFVISAPFSALGGNIGEAGNTLVATPFKATFLRCLGCSIRQTQDPMQ